MLDLLTSLAVAEGEGAASHTLFYVLGGALALWALLLGALGTMRPSLVEGEGGARAIMGISALLVVGACASAVITA